MNEHVDVKHCRKPWETLYIHLNGDVKPCCYATFPVASLNNPGTSLVEVWSGQEMAEVRAAVERNEIHLVCSGAGCAYVRSRFSSGSQAPVAGYGPESGAAEINSSGSLSTLMRTISSWVADPLKALKRFRSFDEIPEGLVEEHTKRLAMLGQRNACFHVGLKFQLKGDRVRAMHWVKKSADKSEPDALHWMALNLFSANYRKPKLAAEYLAKAADAGFVKSITLLGRCYRYGNGVPVDATRAIDLLRKAADLGDPVAWRELAKCYEEGFGVVADAKEAKRLTAIAERREKNKIDSSNQLAGAAAV